jgi:DNA-binding NtrC family response regulator
MPTAVTTGRSSGTIERCRVLVADDDPGARALLRTALDAAGFEVSEVHDGRELYDVLASSPPGYFRVVVADHVMPGLHGLEVLARTSSRARFVLVTGASAAAIEEAADRFGAAALVRKPVDPSRLVRLIRYVALEDDSVAAEASGSDAPRARAVREAPTLPSLEPEDD